MSVLAFGRQGEGPPLILLHATNATRRMTVCAPPQRLSADAAIASAQDAVASRHFPQHVRRTRVPRLTGGAAIPASVPVTALALPAPGGGGA